MTSVSGKALGYRRCSSGGGTAQQRIELGLLSGRKIAPVNRLF
ncbi:hypothetical protein [Halochromatium sp.]